MRLNRSFMQSACQFCSGGHRSRVIDLENNHGDIVRLRGFAAPFLDAAEDLIARPGCRKVGLGFYEFEQTLFAELLARRIDGINRAVSIGKEKIAALELE